RYARYHRFEADRRTIEVFDSLCGMFLGRCSGCAVQPLNACYVMNGSGVARTLCHAIFENWLSRVSGLNEGFDSTQRARRWATEFVAFIAGRRVSGNSVR